MIDYQETIERLEKAKKSCGSIGVAALDEAITALQQMQQRIAELEDRNTALTESENYAMAKASRLDAALDTCSQMILEVAHAQRNGSDWYTKGESGLYRQVSMWIRKASDAINDARAGSVNNGY
jgi:DNA repair exonuclease SbcCD ATPase subunit